MLFNTQFILIGLDNFIQFSPSMSIFIEVIVVLFSIIIVTVGPIINYATKKILEGLGKNAGAIGATVATANLGINIYNTVKNSNENNSGNSNSSEENKDSQDDNKNKVKKDENNPKDDSKTPEPVDSN